MKVIFLDIDGVLNSYDSFGRFGSWYILCPDCVSRLNALVKATNAKVVISSAWRRVRSLPVLRKILTESGLSNSEKVVIGMTPVIYPQPDGRGKEIDGWLNSNEGVDNFVIIDDSTDMEPHLDRLVKTNIEIGLTLANAEYAERMLLDSWKRY
jgi:hypothetical protein